MSDPFAVSDAGCDGVGTTGPGAGRFSTFLGHKTPHGEGERQVPEDRFRGGDMLDRNFDTYDIPRFSCPRGSEHKQHLGRVKSGTDCNFQ